MKFNYCPKCGKDNTSYIINHWKCPDCGFQLYNNNAAACGILVERKGDLLMIQRARDPEKGSWAIPGGFIDHGETAEEAAVREAKEEIGVGIRNIRYFASAPNIYPYGGVTYSTCDLFFTAEILDYNFTLEPREISRAEFFPLDKIDLNLIAFPSVRNIVEKYIISRGQKPQGEAYT